MTVIKATLIPPKMAVVVLLHCVAVPHVQVGIYGNVAGVVGQVEEDCVSTTPVSKNKEHLCW